MNRDLLPDGPMGERVVNPGRVRIHVQAYTPFSGHMQDLGTVFEDPERAIEHFKGVGYIVTGKEVLDEAGSMILTVAKAKRRGRSNPSEPTTPSGKIIPLIRSATYTDKRKWPKYSGPVGPISAHGIDTGKILYERLPDWTKEDHRYASEYWDERAKEWMEKWSEVVEEASQATFGRPYEIMDYKISGIARDEYPDKYKEQLRMYAHDSSWAKDAAYAHRQATRLRRVSNPARMSSWKHDIISKHEPEYREGYTAALISDSDAKKVSPPYTSGSEENAAWIYGWNDAPTSDDPEYAAEYKRWVNGSGAAHNPRYSRVEVVINPTNPVWGIGKLPPNALIEHRPGIWGFVGSVDGRLAYVRKDGSEPTQEEFNSARIVGPGMVGLRSRTWPTRADAVRTAEDLGLQVTFPKSKSNPDSPLDWSQAAFDAGKDWRLSGDYDTSGVADARVVKYGFSKWWNNFTIPQTKSVKKASMERAFREGYAAGKRIEKKTKGFIDPRSLAAAEIRESGLGRSSRPRDLENPSDIGIQLVLGIRGKGASRASETQSVTFDKSQWTIKAAKGWLKEHGYKTPSADVTKGRLRFRQESPRKYREFATITPGEQKNPCVPNPGDMGIQLVLGIRGRGSKRVSETQAVTFDKEQWTIPEATNWLQQHDYKTPTPTVTKQRIRFQQESPKGYREFATIVPGSNPSFRRSMKEAKKRAALSLERWGTDYGGVARDRVLADKRAMRVERAFRRADIKLKDDPYADLGTLFRAEGENPRGSRLVDELMNEHIHMLGFPQLIVTRGFAADYLKNLGWGHERGTGSLDYAVFSKVATNEPLTPADIRDRYLNEPEVVEGYRRNPDLSILRRGTGRYSIVPSGRIDDSFVIVDNETPDPVYRDTGRGEALPKTVRSRTTGLPLYFGTMGQAEDYLRRHLS